MNTVETKRKRAGRTKAQRKRDYEAVMERLRNTPENQLSPAAKYFLAHANDEPVRLNLRYVMR